MHGAHIGGPAPSYQQYMAQRNTQAPAATSAAAVGARYPPHNPQLRHAMPGQAQPPVPPGSYPNPVPATIPEKTPYQSEVQKVEQERAEHEAAFARAFMPTDLSLPEGIDEVIPFPDMIEACNYKLQVSEERAAIIRRKFAEYHERFFHGSRAHLNYETLVPGNWKAHRSHKLHLRISNTCENQPWQYDALEENAFDFDSGVDPKYKVTIEGCLVPDAEDEKEWDDLNTIWPEEWKDTDDEAEDEDEAERDGMTDGPAADKSAAAENGEEITAAISAKDDNGKDKAANGAEPRKRKTKHIKPEPKPLAYFFKRMSVEYDRPAALQPDGFKAINWEKPDIPPQVRELPLVARCRSWAFERKGDENMSVTIKLWRDEKPEVFRLSDPLAEMLASRYATREEIMSGMWEYVKLMKCHRDPTSKRVACNDDMKAVRSLFMPLTLSSMLTPAPSRSSTPTRFTTPTSPTRSRSTSRPRSRSSCPTPSAWTRSQRPSSRPSTASACTRRPRLRATLSGFSRRPSACAPSTRPPLSAPPSRLPISSSCAAASPATASSPLSPATPSASCAASSPPSAATSLSSAARSALPGRTAGLVMSSAVGAPTASGGVTLCVRRLDSWWRSRRAGASCFHFRGEAISSGPIKGVDKTGVCGRRIESVMIPQVSLAYFPAGNYTGFSTRPRALGLMYF